MTNRKIKNCDLRPITLAKITLIFCILLLPGSSCVAKGSDEYPKIANYYLQPLVPQEDVKPLAKYDLVVLDVDAQTSGSSLLHTLKGANPNIKTFAYIPSQSVNVQDLGSWANFRRDAYAYTDSHNGWLKDSNGNYVHFSNTWPTIRFVDMGNGWTDFISTKAQQDVIARGNWDGIFYDMVFANLSWLNGGNIDLDRDGRSDSISTVNSYWQKKNNELIDKTQAKTKAPVIANVDIPEVYDRNLEGIMMENYPASWMGANGWSRLQKTYQAHNGSGKLDIINVNTDNSGNQTDYQKMRFGLASTLMSNGYYSFDHGDQNHAQTWWYDEYDADLGKAKSAARNVLNNKGAVEAGLWRRDFERGTAFVNSSNRIQTVVFKDEEFTKLNGQQDRKVNNGSRVNYVRLNPKDGIILKKETFTITNAAFDNGAFVRVFNQSGKKAANGFFAYTDGFSGNSPIINADIDGDKQLETLVDGSGAINIFDNGKFIKSFRPYGQNYRKTVSFAVADLNGDGKKEIITGAGPGGGPHIKIFNKDGRELTNGFFAFDKNFRGGVYVAVGDISGDGVPEIVAGAGQGGGPQIKVFNAQGKLLTTPFFAYDQKLRSGVTVATGDTDGDGRMEIITAPANGGGPQVKIFNSKYKLIGQFFAYDQKARSKLRVLVDDINKDKRAEIMVSTVNYLQ